MKVEVRVYPREGILDPQGKAIAAALVRLGHSSVEQVRAGKVFFLEIAGDDRTRGNGSAADGGGAPREHGDRGLRRPGAMKFAIVVFPGSNCDQDCEHVAKNLLGCEADYVWHADTDLKGADVVVIPGGFAYGDYLRAGALARFSPVMESVASFAKGGGPVLGICNGFQVLLEAALLPGAMRVNRGLRYVCRDVNLKVENEETPFTRLYEPGTVVRMPIGHMEGNYTAPPHVLDELEAEDRVVFRYCDERGRSPRRREPERGRPGDRRDLQPGTQRGRADAASRTGVRRPCSATTRG